MIPADQSTLPITTAAEDAPPAAAKATKTFSRVTQFDVIGGDFRKTSGYFRGDTFVLYKAEQVASMAWCIGAILGGALGALFGHTALQVGFLVGAFLGYLYQHLANEQEYKMSNIRAFDILADNTTTSNNPTTDVSLNFADGKRAHIRLKNANLAKLKFALGENAKL